MRDAEAVACRLDEVVLQLLSRSESDRVHQHIELCVALLELREDMVDFFVIRDIALEGLRAWQVGDQLMRFGLHAFVLVADSKPASGLLKPLSDTPGDAAFVGESEDGGDATFKVKHGTTFLQTKRIAAS